METEKSCDSGQTWILVFQELLHFVANSVMIDKTSLLIHFSIRYSALPLTPDTSPETSPSSTKPVPENSQNLVSVAAGASPAHSIATSESSTTLSELINRASTIYDDLMDLE